MGSSEESEGGAFTTVAREKRPPLPPRKTARKGKSRKEKQQNPHHRFRERTLDEKLEQRRQLLAASGYVAATRALVKDALTPSTGNGRKLEACCPLPTCIVCLGLGSVVESSKSQDQFILMQGVLEELSELNGGNRLPVSLYDPAFTEDDHAFFQSEGYEVLPHDHTLAYDSSSLLYMPHCPRSLYEDLVSANWSRGRIRNVSLLGNNLDVYSDPAHPSASSIFKTPFILKSLPLWTKEPLPPDKDVFNELALQWVTVAAIGEQSEEFWGADSIEDCGSSHSRDGVEEIGKLLEITFL